MKIKCLGIESNSCSEKSKTYMGCNHIIEEGSDVVFSNYILPVVSNIN